MDNLEDELDAYNDIVDAKIKSIEKESDERSYTQDLTDLQDEKQKIVDKINLLSMDDSVEAKQKKIKLQEELQEITRQIEDLQYGHTRDARIDSLNEQKDAFEEEIQARKDAEDEMHKATERRLEEDRKAWERYYDDLINDERKFAQIRAEIMKGNFSTITSDFKTFQTFLSANLTSIGESIVTNLINKFKEAEAAARRAYAIIQAGDGSGGSGGGGGGSSGGITISAGQYENLNGTAIMPSRTLAGLLGATVSWDQATGEVIIGGKRFTPVRNVNGTTWIPIRQVAEKLGHTVSWDNTSGAISIYHQGGVVGNNSSGAPSGIMDIVNKLFNVGPNEQIIKSLVGELQIPQANVFNNFIPNMKNLMSSASPVLASTGNMYEININIENMSGTKKDADNLATTLVNKLKRKGAM
jgi:FtsZ-binding cell division protein ZapB